MSEHHPRIIIAGTHSGVGKSTVTTGIMQALTSKGYRVQGFKVGPDYIDTSYHSYVTGRASRNLDSYLLGKDQLLEVFLRQARQAELTVIEGVMGLFDGKDGKSELGSTAEIAKITKTPVILVVDCRSMARSTAAVVKGFAEFDRELKLQGIILNQVGSTSHEQMLREALSDLGLPIVGAVPRGALPKLPERHLGLVPMCEKGVTRETFELLSLLIEKYLDIDLLLKIAKNVEAFEEKAFTPTIFLDRTRDLFAGLRIGFAWDEAFSFYYRDSLDYLEHLGARLVPFSPLHDEALPPDLSGIIIGGGFPELYAQKLSANQKMLAAVFKFGREGKPVYAECGGLMYLSREIVDFEGNSFRQVGLIPAKTLMQKKLQALGYFQGESLTDSILGPKGTKLKGHEFHYSVLEDSEEYPLAVKLYKGPGTEKLEGFCQGGVYASYLHQHWAGQPEVAQAFLHSCLVRRGNE